MTRTILLAGLLALAVALPTLGAADPWRAGHGGRSAPRYSYDDWQRGRDQYRNQHARRRRADHGLYDSKGRRRLDWEDDRGRGREDNRHLQDLDPYQPGDRASPRNAWPW